MKKIFCFLCAFFLLTSVGLVALADDTFDYAKFFPQKTFEAINQSQGSFYVFTVGQTEGIILDPGKGLVLTVAHLFDYLVAPETSSKICLFIFKEEIFKVKILKISQKFDLALVQLEPKGLKGKSLIDLGAKKVVFQEKFSPFKEYYSFEREFSFSIFGIEKILELPFSARIVGKKTIKSLKDGEMVYLYLDKNVKGGFSGAGVFNEEGELLGMVDAIDGGYSLVMPTSEIRNFLESNNDK